jgi:hypothetical protein
MVPIPNTIRKPSSQRCWTTCSAELALLDAGEKGSQNAERSSEYETSARSEVSLGQRWETEGLESYCSKQSALEWVSTSDRTTCMHQRATQDHLLPGQQA